MRNETIWAWVCSLVVATAGGAGAAEKAKEATSFEGTVKQVTLVMPTAPLMAAVDELSPQQVFAISDDRLAEIAKDPNSNAQVNTSTIQIKGAKFRVDMTINDQPGYMLVDSATETGWLVSTPSKVYVEWTKAAREAQAKKLDTQSRTKDVLRDQAEKLPPEERERLKAALGPTAAPTAPPAQPELKTLEQNGIVNGALSTLWELRQGNTVSRAWVTDNYPALLAAFRAASETQHRGGTTRKSTIELFASEGLPMRVQTLAPNRYEQVDIIEIKEESVSDEVFKIPPDFTKVDPNAPPPAAAAPPAGTPGGATPAAGTPAAEAKTPAAP
jgi:hypothetical protein